jgi:aspartate racemase
MPCLKQKRLGIVGGIGPESTIEYYRAILAIYREYCADGPTPSIVIISIDVQTLLSFMASGDLGALVRYLHSAVQLLAAAGADFALVAANTPHIVFDELCAACRIPLISIVTATRDHAKSLGLRKLGLLGTRYTMQARFYPEVFEKSGISVISPSGEEQQYIHDKYVGELLQGIFLPGTERGLISVIERMKERDAIDGVILGGTELPLILKDNEISGLPLLDTTKIHAQAAVLRLLER